MCPHKKKTFLRLYADDKKFGTFINPVFEFTAIENITGFQIKQFIFNSTGLTETSLKINSQELSNLTYNTIMGSYNKASQTLHEVVVGTQPIEVNNESPKYYVNDGRISRISFDMLGQDGTSYDAQFDDDINYSILICFYHD